jgi:thiosulfate/3-mercaptopyruvate sulfurtransferase
MAKTIYRTLIDCERLADLIADGAVRLFDCRFNLADTAQGERDFGFAHIPGAYYAHLDRDLSSAVTDQSGRHPLPHVDRLAEWLGAHGVTQDTQVVAYDDTGGTMAVRLWWLLRWLGHDQVALLDGGWQAWQQAGRPTEYITPEPATACRFQPRPDRRMLVSTEDVRRYCAGDQRDMLLLDARTAERFQGIQEPIDPVAGHIPGATNLPLQANLDGNGRFRTAGELRCLYLKSLHGQDPSEVAAMCGSGVTACHNLLAMEIAGLHGGRLYAGSWSEWIRDAANPVAVGE